jgi:MatE
MTNMDALILVGGTGGLGMEIAKGYRSHTVIVRDAAKAKACEDIGWIVDHVSIPSIFSSYAINPSWSTLVHIISVFFTTIEVVSDQDEGILESSKSNKDDDNDSGNSSIDFSFLESFRSQTSTRTPARSSICFAGTAKSGVSHDVMDTTESTSEETIECGGIKEIALNQLDISAASNSKGDDSDNSVFDMHSMSTIEGEEIEKSPLLNELYLITSLAVPSMIIEITTSIPYMITTSYIGRNFEPICLVGYSLANSLGNISTNMLLLGVFSTSDTLSPQAFGAKNYNELGLIAIRVFLLAHAVTMPVTIALFIWMNPTLIGLGQSIEAAEKATEWFRISAFCLPVYIFFQVIWKFLSAQHILGPLVVTSLFCAVLLTPLMVNALGSRFGYLGTSGSKFFVTICQALMLLLYLQYRKPHHPETWTGLSVQKLKLALDCEKFICYFSLCLGGILAR